MSRKREKEQMAHRRIRKWIRGCLLCVMAVCLILMARSYYISSEQEKQQSVLQERIRQERTEEGPVAPDTGADVSLATAPAVSQEPVVLSKYASLYKENSDLAGWLTIPGMVIDDPVMQCGDDEYYLHRDFDRKKSKYGCLYVRGRADVNTPGTNIIIYGHNMKDGKMFGDLDLYEQKSFFRKHPKFRFDTLYEERTYKILAVFRSKVYDTDDNVFKYYQFYEAETEKEFDEFYDNIKKLSLYDTGVEAEFGDTFVTLSTCAYHVEDGRFVVVAKRVTE